MCEPALAARLTEAEIAALTTGLRAMEGAWSVFPHVDAEGAVTLLLTPAAWEGTETALLVQREAEGLCVLLSEEDEITRLGCPAEPEAVLALLARALRQRQRHAA
ncbi:hypothetical protein [Pseudoroseomonas cervicalis]|uniref:hypothetical protein n=1 Tax=Teichococcus cervicalis TaxID=204525 RepID=UPI0022F1644E|nr:hypothetical protein [Pseudoroseomonas cervicalis]WBV43407.1 hypothetical protein PFY06_02195 [Pseudoroseomonas cervicalis]